MRLRLLLLSALLLMTAGCSRVSELYYLRGDFDPAAARDLPLKQVYMAPDLASIRGKTLTVKLADPTKTIQPQISKINKRLDANFWQKKWQPDFEKFLANTLWQTAIFSDVCPAGDIRPIKQPDLIFRVALTRYHEGNKWLRVYLGLGAGATRMQWEGAIVDAKTNRVLFAFADARMHPGGPQAFGFPLKVWRGWALIADDLRDSAYDVREVLHDHSGTDKPMLPKSERYPGIRQAGRLQSPPATPPPAEAGVTLPPGNQGERH